MIEHKGRYRQRVRLAITLTVELIAAGAPAYAQSTSVPEQSESGLAVQVVEFAAICASRCDQWVVRLKITNIDKRPLCIPSHSINHLVTQYVEYTDVNHNEIKELPYRGGPASFGDGDILDGRNITFPVYVLNPGQIVQISTTETNFPILEYGENVIARIGIPFFSCGTDASEASQIQLAHATSPISYMHGGYRWPSR